jgi:hypothetical protein
MWSFYILLLRLLWRLLCMLLNLLLLLLLLRCSCTWRLRVLIIPPSQLL